MHNSSLPVLQVLDKIEKPLERTGCVQFSVLLADHQQNLPTLTNVLLHIGDSKVLVWYPQSQTVLLVYNDGALESILLKIAHSHL